MRIHTIFLKNAGEFFMHFKSDHLLYAFSTKASFVKDEEFIFEIFFIEYASREHLRVKVSRVSQTKLNTSKVIVKILPFQTQKIEFISYLASTSTKWVSQRSAIRYAVSIRGSWSFESTDLWHPCEIKDMGTGGLQFLGSSSPSQNYFLYLRFKIPQSSHTIKIKCKVVWTKRIGANSTLCGVSFVQSDSSQKYKASHKALRKFFRECEIHGNSMGFSKQISH